LSKPNRFASSSKIAPCVKLVATEYREAKTKSLCLE
jgi:hypothetical protein